MSVYHGDTPLCECSFSVTDTETTVTPLGTRILEIAAVQVLPGFRIDFPNAFQTLINPRYPIDRSSMAIHGITDEMAASAPFETEVIEAYSKFIETTIFVAHNVPFDYGLLSGAMERNDIVSPVIYLLDTVKLSRRLYPYLPNHTLDTLMRAHGLASPRDARHRALYDADITAMLLVKILTELSAVGVTTLGDIYAYVRGL
jgi:DNA polymerase III epsilon subunit family exonuclease